MLDILRSASLSLPDFDENVEFLIDGFLPKRMITMVYADGGNGKSWLAMALANTCASFVPHVVYLDFDNPLSVLKERNVNKQLVDTHPNLLYVQRSKSELQAEDLLFEISRNATAHAYDGMFFILDSLRNFGEVNNDAKIMNTMNMLMDIREAGGTILILHHSNKDGKNYQGSNNIRNTVDNMYQLQKREMSQQVGVILSVKKERASISDKAYEIDPDTLMLTACDLIEAQSSEQDLDFVSEIKTVLTSQPNLNKSELLKHAGYAKDDKTARSRLDKYDGIYWHSTKNHTTIRYNLTA
ncbi:MAG: hypothetical protein Alis3KO_00770 [Aliiglaciecola sp.]